MIDLFALLDLQLAPSTEEWRLLGVKLINLDDFLKLLLKFILNFAVTFVVVRGLYYRTARRPDYVFTYLLIGTTVFLLCFLLESVKLELGFALGLFAIFGIIRYRTDAIPIKEMTYLFVVIGLAVLNALSNKKVSYAELVFANSAIVVLLAIFEASWIPRHEAKVLIQYEKVELVLPERRGELIEDLRQRTGLDVQRVDVDEMSFLRDTANLVVYHRPPGHRNYQPVKKQEEGRRVMGVRALTLGATILAVMLFNAPAKAQEELTQETQIRVGAKVEKRIIKGLRAYAAPEMRTDEFNPDRYLLEVGARYKPIKYFSMVAGFRADLEERKSGLDHGYRPKVDLVGLLPLGDFEAHLRWRYTHAFGPDRNERPRFRYRAGLDWGIPKSDFALDLSVEPFHALNGPVAGEIYKIRYRAGVSWKFYKSKKHDHWLSLGYMLDYFLTERTNRHIPMLNYKVRF